MTDPGDSPDHPRHGGDLAYATKTYGSPASGWLDLSTGIAPFPYPALPVSAADLARLPDADALRQLIVAARTAYGVPDSVKMMAVPGSELAIGALPHVAPSGLVAIVGPTYGSHARAWARYRVVQVPTLDEVPSEVAVLVVTNPNNPDGRTLTPERLANAAQAADRRSRLLVVDEAFADVSPEVSLVGQLDAAPAIVLRSFGKFHGLAGLRLGFVVGHGSTLQRLREMLGDWPVSSAALAIGTAALADDRWREEQRGRLRDAVAQLRALLTHHGLRIVGGTDLFVLVEVAGARAVHEALARRGVWTRVFAERPDWLRLGLPPDEAGFARLDAALAAARAATPTPAAAAR